MKKLFFALVASALIVPAVSAQTHVRGYTRKDGTYVAPHYRSSPNSTPYDNYSTRGNTNPYTGQTGTKDPYSTTLPSAPPSYKPKCYYNCPK